MDVLTKRQRKYRTQESLAFKTNMAEGKQLSKAMDPIRTLREVADILGISHEAVRRIEYRALSKVACKMKQIYGPTM